MLELISLSEVVPKTTCTWGSLACISSSEVLGSLQALWVSEICCSWVCGSKVIHIKPLTVLLLLVVSAYEICQLQMEVCCSCLISVLNYTWRWSSVQNSIVTYHVQVNNILCVIRIEMWADCVLQLVFTLDVAPALICNGQPASTHAGVMIHINPHVHWVWKRFGVLLCFNIAIVIHIWTGDVACCVHARPQRLSSCTHCNTHLLVHVCCCCMSMSLARLGGPGWMWVQRHMLRCLPA